MQLLQIDRAELNGEYYPMSAPDRKSKMHLNQLSKGSSGS